MNRTWECRCDAPIDHQVIGLYAPNATEGADNAPLAARLLSDLVIDCANEPLRSNGLLLTDVTMRRPLRAVLMTSESLQVFDCGTRHLARHLSSAPTAAWLYRFDQVSTEV